MEYVRRVTAPPGPRHADLARLWAPTTAAGVEVLPEGRVFYPRMLEDIASGPPLRPHHAVRLPARRHRRPVRPAAGGEGRRGCRRSGRRRRARQPRVHRFSRHVRRAGRRRCPGHAARPGAARSSRPGRGPPHDDPAPPDGARRAPQARARRWAGGVHRRRRPRGSLLRRSLPRRLRPIHRAGDAAAPGDLPGHRRLSRRRPTRWRRPAAGVLPAGRRRWTAPGHDPHELAARMASADRCRVRADPNRDGAARHHELLHR